MSATEPPTTSKKRRKTEDDGTTPKAKKAKTKSTDANLPVRTSTPVPIPGLGLSNGAGVALPGLQSQSIPGLGKSPVQDGVAQVAIEGQETEKKRKKKSKDKVSEAIVEPDAVPAEQSAKKTKSDKKKKKETDPDGAPEKKKWKKDKNTTPADSAIQQEAHVDKPAEKPLISAELQAEIRRRIQLGQYGDISIIPNRALADLEGILTKPATPANPGFFVEEMVMYLPVPPICANYPLEGAINNSLSRIMFEYYAPLNGVLVGYENARITTPPNDAEQAMTKVSDGYYMNYLWVAADLFIFRPSHGAWIQGRISAQFESHIALIVDGIWRASIPAKRLPKNWRWIPDQEDGEELRHDKVFSIYDLKLGGAGQWFDGNAEAIHGNVVFRARDFDIAAKRAEITSVLSIEGTMLEEEEDKEVDNVDELSAPSLTNSRRAAAPVRIEKEKESGPVAEEPAVKFVPLKPQHDELNPGPPSRKKKTKDKGKAIVTSSS